MAKTTKCRHCEAVIEQRPGPFPTLWVHGWNGFAQCISMVSRKPLGTDAAPREDKTAKEKVS